jgi:AraC family transcriptional regulator
MRLPPGHFYGQIVKSIKSSGLILAETIYPPGFQVPKHSHELFQFCLVREGSFTDISGRRSRECRPLTLFSHPSDETHANVYHGSGARCFVIEIGHNWIERAREHSVALDDPVEFNGGLPTWLATKLYDECRSIDDVSPLAIEGLTLEIMAAAARHTVNVSGRGVPRWLEQARDILYAHFAERLTLTGIAESVGVHPVYLASVFRKQYGCTIGTYVRRLRIEFACRQISKDDLRLVEVALAAGFTNQAHFTRTFTRLMGITPTEYRRTLRPS